MIAHFSLSHLTDPIVALAGGVLLLFYVAWRITAHLQLQTRESVSEPDLESTTSSR